jgi:hypothetical protein
MDYEKFMARFTIINDDLCNRLDIMIEMLGNNTMTKNDSITNKEYDFTYKINSLDSGLQDLNTRLTKLIERVENFKLHPELIKFYKEPKKK